MPTPLPIDLHLYAGRYIALIEGRVVAVADTAAAAQARAAAARPQRPAIILHVAAEDERR